MSAAFDELLEVPILNVISASGLSEEETQLHASEAEFMHQFQEFYVRAHVFH